MLKVKVIRLDKTGNIKEYTMNFRDTKNNNLEIEKLAEIAEDCYVDKLNNWKQLTKQEKEAKYGNNKNNKMVSGWWICR